MCCIKILYFYELFRFFGKIISFRCKTTELVLWHTLSKLPPWNTEFTICLWSISRWMQNKLKLWIACFNIFKIPRNSVWIFWKIAFSVRYDFIFEVTRFDDEDYACMYSFVYSETNVPLVVKFLESFLKVKREMKIFEF